MTLSTRPPQGAASPTRGFRFMRDIPTALWLIAAVVSTVLHRVLPAPRWLMIHLLLLGAITHAILVWSEYFSFALLRSRASRSDRRRQNIRLILANLGAIAVFIGVPSGFWPSTVAGAAALIAAVGWHSAALVRRSRRSLPGKFGRTVRYYIAASAFLVVGAALGALIATGHGAARLGLAHALINLLGWVGLTVAGTLVTLWPTILRTRADDQAASGAASALPALCIGAAAAALGAVLGVPALTAAGLVAYLIGLVVIGFSGFRAARQSPPTSFAALSIAAAFAWWAVVIAFIAGGSVVGQLRGADAAETAGLIGGAVPYLAAGFAAQVLPGALSYLIPVVLGGGPTPVRIGTAAFERWGVLRVTVANAALIVCAMPVTSLVRVVASVLYLIAMASFLVILFTSMRAQSRAKRGGRQRKPEPPAAHRGGQLVAGLLTVVLAVAITVSADPSSTGWRVAQSGPDDAPVTTVQVEAANMRFTPNEIAVPAGNRLVIELTNTDPELTHDLVFENGVVGSRLAPGESETIDVGVITENLDGWCSIVGHRQMGMTLAVTVAGSEASSAPSMHGDLQSSPSSGDAIDLMGEPGDRFTPYDPVLPPLPASDGPITHREHLVVQDTEVEIAPGVTQTLWTYNQTAPGPVLHGRIGDRFEITLTNDGSIGHSIDFHAGALAPDQPMRTIAPGETLTFAFTATRAGIWMYHCSTMPMTAHIANGMYGTVIIEPDGLPEVDRSYVLTQGEYYLGDHDGGDVEPEKIARRAPDLVTFNGYANQYDHRPLGAAVGERVRVWVLDAGIERASSFHVIGGQFDTVWSEGRYLIDRSPDTGSQALALAPAQGGFVELVFPEAGDYPFVSHYMIDAEMGARGTFAVTP
ncbi:multicopper oxidase domain-containing protein [Leucobacter sp. GX0328]